ncbi:UDP-N-acetylmuramate--L-alanine ligase [Streptantibioticus ferralitis]|uniref:UDP-N-acetylmuramate--L-alanine ligase n=1 Tax=Streptantibioticus ferralitis TaxID=236510 RepID=A0ABT5Z1D9_9ACTN|nr:UDP-N-acetylmuramate--L-alanine ligase [Streptantibioticus ferralitis]MDF2257659.1 UDP-N-acetylmuramate--L-alanine ligase [Streptantibioticus ferralitis]
MTETKYVELPGPERDFDWRRPYFVGIGGVGMAPLAAMCRAHGSAVAGHDRRESPAIGALKERGVQVTIGDRREAAWADLGRSSVVVRSTAVRDDDPLLQAARQAGIPVVHRSDLLAELMAGHRPVAVAGTHGKTTASAMLARALEEAGGDPSYVFGGDTEGPLSGVRVSPYESVFVAEADESDGSFTRYAPSVGVVLNVDDDHPERYAGVDDAVEAFIGFAATVREGGTLVCSADDAGARRVAEAASARGLVNVVLVGEADDAHWRVLDVTAARDGLSSQVVVCGPEESVHSFTVHTPGRHNAGNAVAALAAGVALGFTAADLLPGLQAFAGVERRLQVVGDARGVVLIDSFAHHPTAITADIAAARAVAGDGGRVIVVCQPSGYGRVQALARALGQALAAADEVFLLKLHDLVGDPVPGVDSELIAGCLRDSARHAAVQVREGLATVRALDAVVKPGDVVLTTGPGQEVTRVAEGTLCALASAVFAPVV